ncbi:aminotransferase class III-fold pyridoxal phosphate-dependent enzyme [Desulfospira joergensenii]|uniref:aminotransferase class III-fold pyridoxal phosphate-dependent enzyme n=1 Tax=Desulfospira joergensenii TaxID=53329 RepID=UPI0003B46368|nr:aminotransferase class III-fold pyridoxal phosphate-dependent enzyme [Desulfospira joergensenii]
MTKVYTCTGHELKIPDITAGEGIYLFDAHGKRYMDLESGVWCTALGHKNLRVNEAITQQMEVLTHAGFCYSNPVLETAAEAVLDIADFAGGRALFLCSGSEAIEISRQMAKHLTGKELSMTLHDSYLGAYSSVTNRTRDWFLFNWEPCRTCEKQEACDPSCRAFDAVPTNISDFVFEPGSSSGFVRFPPKAMIQNLGNRVRANGGKIIANEVTTGIGRTGKWFGFQHYPILPDLIAMGKGLGNGYPVSAAAIHPDMVRELENRPFKYAQSHQNDPLGAAAALAVIQEIQVRGLIKEAGQKGAGFLERLRDLVDHEIILGVRGRGLMFAVDLANEKIAEKIYDNLIRKGYILCNRGTSFRIDPPLTITPKEINSFMDAFEEEVSSQKR